MARKKSEIEVDHRDILRNQPCEVCGRYPSEPDHIRTRGAGGGHERKNLQALCRKHHTERHTMGLKSFVAKYHLPISWENGYPERSD